jgi:hypothetical protein
MRALLRLRASVESRGPIQNGPGWRPPPRQPEYPKRRPGGPWVGVAPTRRKLRKSRRFPLTSRPISYIMLTIKSGYFRHLFARSKPESGYLFPPSAYCPHDCDDCSLPCNLSRYHVGPHTCGKRHRFNSPLAFFSLEKFLYNFLTCHLVRLVRPLLRFLSLSGRLSSGFRSCSPASVSKIQPLQGAMYA